MNTRLTDAEMDSIAEKAAEKVISKMTSTHMDQIAEKAADKAVAKMTNMVYLEVGKGVISKLLWLVGVMAIAGYAYAQGKGWVGK